MQIFGIPALIDTYENYIWVLTENQRAWVIDPGEAAPVLAFLREHDLTLEGILITHRHGDHVNGVQQLQRHTPDITIYGPALAPLDWIQHRLKEGDVVQLFADYALQVLDTPGHTEDHISFFNDKDLFCGDTLFTAGCGRILGGTIEQFSDSILKLRALPDSLNFYCAHEYTHDNLAFAQLIEPDNLTLQARIKNFHSDYPTVILGQPLASLGLEKQTNPFMRFDFAHFSRPLSQTSNAKAFAELRGLKDAFDKNGKLP